ncbi:Ger(x)C family spore germination protein [Paenibacillaceae bacterium]|nr:Ger(x)C family spore germination protein [Paenibacillaceae bacterium]
MMRRISLLCLLTISLLTLPGCWDREEMNDLAIALGIGVDKDGDMTRVTAQVVVPSSVSSKAGSAPGSPVTLYEASAATLFEAIQKLTEESPRKVFLSHIRVLVFGESFARGGIAEVLEGLVRDPSVRPDYYVMIAKNTTANNILNVLTPLDRIPSEKLYNSLEVSARTWAPTTTATADQLMTDIINDIQPVITGVVLTGDPKVGGSDQNIQSADTKSKLKFTGVGVFNKDRLVGWLSEQHSKGYNYIRNKVSSTVGHSECPGGGEIALRVLRTTTKMKAKMENDEPVIDIHVEHVSIIQGVECIRKIDSTEVIYELEKENEKRIVQLMQDSVTKVQQEFNLDIFGFGDAIRRANPAVWKKLEPQWESKFRQLNINYSCKILIKGMGTLDDSFLDQLKG